MLAQKSILLLSLTKLKQHLDFLSEKEIEHKASEKIWSRKEIIGHLIDSSLLNIRRFNDVQISPLPYKVEKYSQDLLVKTNKYQEANIDDLYALLSSLNFHIAFMIENCLIPYTNKKVIIDNKTKTVGFLVEDYVAHFIHHVNQI